MADACQRTDVKSSAASEDFTSYNFYFELLSVILYGVSFKQIQTFNQNTIFFIEQRVYKQQWRVKIRIKVKWINARFDAKL